MKSEVVMRSYSRGSRYGLSLEPTVVDQFGRAMPWI